jgi:hypothetical protein
MIATICAACLSGRARDWYSSHCITTKHEHQQSQPQESAHLSWHRVVTDREGDLTAQNRALQALEELVPPVGVPRGLTARGMNDQEETHHDKL